MIIQFFLDKLIYYYFNPEIVEQFCLTWSHTGQETQL